MTLSKLHALIYKVIKDCIIRTNNCYLATVEKRYFKVKYAAPILNSKQPKIIYQYCLSGGQFYFSHVLCKEWLTFVWLK